MIRGLACSAMCAWGLMLMLGCTALRDETDTFATAVQSGRLTRWGCLGQEPKPPPNNIPSMVTYTTDVVDWVSNGPPAGLQICVCAQVDVPGPSDAGTAVPCNTPLGQRCFTPPPEPNVAISLPGGREDIFIAFLTPTTVPDALYFNRAPTNNPFVGKPPIRLITFMTAQSLAQSFGLSLDPALGLVVMRVFDCNGAPAPDVYFTLSPAPTNIIPFAYRNNAPSPLVKTTDDTGQFGFANALPGSALARAFLQNDPANAADDTEIGSVPFTVRGGWATLVDLRQ